VSGGRTISRCFGFTLVFTVCAAAQTPAPYRQRVVHEGIAVDLNLDAPRAHERKPATFREGDTLDVQFRLSDAATGSALTAANPAAWLDLHPSGEPDTPERCLAKIERFTGGGIFGKPEADLTTYYVVALNEDPSVTVVDPRFGFGDTKLLAIVPLMSQGYDWALSSNHELLFVSMPASDRVAVIETTTWKVVGTLNVGKHPTLMGVQPDGVYLWVASDAEDGASVMAAVALKDLSVAKKASTGKGGHALSFSDDSRWVFVANNQSQSVSIIDTRTLVKAADVDVGARPVSIAFSKLAGAAFVACDDGSIVALDSSSHRIRGRSQADAGLTRIRIAPGGRFAFAVNPKNSFIYVLDTATGAIVQKANVEKTPDDITFSDKLAYVRHAGSETVLMVPLDEVGRQGSPVAVADFPGGQHPPGAMTSYTPAAGIVQASGENAVLVANPQDESIYFYKEGMAAPMGNFSDYGKQPRAVLVIERNLRERAPGLYRTTVALRRPGSYTLAFFLDRPKILQCFEFSVDPDPDASNYAGPHARVEALALDGPVSPQTRTHLRLRVLGARNGKPLADVKDLWVLAIAPGVWQRRELAVLEGDGVYAVDMVLPQYGSYYVYVSAPSLNLVHGAPVMVLKTASLQ
jgi:YVTN family beta-propeller protein